MKNKSRILIIALFLLIGLAKGVDAQWVQCDGPYGGRIGSLLKKDSTFFITTGSGVLKSSNYGDSWETINTGLNNDSMKISTIIFKNDTLYVAGGFPGIYMSTNFGVSWNNVSSVFIIITKLKTNGNTIFSIGNTVTGIKYSNDNGVTWASMTGLPFSNVYNMAFKDSNIYVSTENGIYLSTNNGAIWTAINNGFPLNPHCRLVESELLNIS